jgi:fructose-1,6-bisphosphatase class II
MNSSFAFDMVRVVEAAGVAAARTLGQGDGERSDQVAVTAMRQAFDSIPIRGRIVIGEGERDDAPMLYIGESVGGAPESGDFDEIDIAVDPVEGTNLIANGTPNAIAVLAAAEKGGLLHAPDCYMEKIVAGPACRGALDLEAPVEENLKAIASCLNRDVSDLVIVVLDRPRHEKLIGDIRRVGARIMLIPDGDVAAGISAAINGSGVHALMGTGGAPEGVILAAAIRCLHGAMQGRLVIDSQELEERVLGMGIKDPHRIYRARDLAPGQHLVFAACGVTKGTLLEGVRFFGGGHRTHSLVLTRTPNLVRFLDTVHMDRPPGPRGVRLH